MSKQPDDSTDADESDADDGPAPVDAASSVLALDAAIRTAVANAGGSYYRSQFTLEDVLTNAKGDTSKRTVRRTLSAADALGWVDAGYQNSPGYRPGERAERYAAATEEEE